MTAIQLILTYLGSLVTFLLIDGIWLGLVAKNFYKDQLGTLMTEHVNWSAAIIFYLLYIVAVIVFAVLPAAQTGSLLRATLLGGLFGGIAYATYDLTNLATLRDWPLTMTIVDIIWGTILTATVASVGYTLTKFLV